MLSDMIARTKKSKNFTIYGVKGSAAEDYASENGFAFVEIKNETTLPDVDSDEYIDTETATMPNIAANTTAETIIPSLSSYGIAATITDKDGNELESNAKVGPGCKVTDSGGNNYTVIVKGDVDGTGEVNSTDYLQTKKYFLGQLNLYA